MKSKSYRFLLAGFFTIFFLTGAILSCSSGGSSSSPGAAPATIPAVVFIADKDDNDVDELYVVLNDSPFPVKLSGAMVLNGDVIDFKISPDGTRVAYRADQDTNDVIELYVNDIDGGNLFKVSFLPNPILFPGRNVQVDPLVSFDAYFWSPDSSMIAYIADQNVDDKYELFVSTLVPLFNFRVSDAALIVDGDILEFEWAPDSTLIAYRADQIVNGIIELFTTQPVATPTPIKVSGPLVGGEKVDVEPGSTADVFTWAPDSSRIAYIADQDANDVFELYTALPTVIGLPDKISGSLTVNGDVKEFKWALDSSRVAYLADQDINGVIELYSADPAPIAVPDFVKVCAPLGAPQNVEEFAWAPDSSRIAYIADQDTAGITELYTSLPDGGDNKRVSGTLIAGRLVADFAWAPDSSMIAYRADQDTDDDFDLYTALSDTINGDVKVSRLDPLDPLTPNPDVEDDFAWAPDSSRIAYRADQDDDDIIELYSSAPDGSVNDKVSGPLVSPDSDVAVLPLSTANVFGWAPDGSRIAYVSDQDFNDVFELYSSVPDGSGNGKISGPIDPDGDVINFEYEP